jgi:hypothetical protein
VWGVLEPVCKFKKARSRAVKAEIQVKECVGIRADSGIILDRWISSYGPQERRKTGCAKCVRTLL